jgi:hypothetical protein
MEQAKKKRMTGSHINDNQPRILVNFSPPSRADLSNQDWEWCHDIRTSGS